jgi:glucokinase
VYANAAALLRYAGPEFESTEAVISAANEGSAPAREALETYASYLSTGLVSMAHLLDPEMVILSGGLAQNNPLLVSSLNQQLAGKLNVPNLRKLEVRVSELGYHGGVLGAAAVAVSRP